MQIQFRIVLIALALLACTSNLFAADVAGWFDTDCSGMTFHITKIAAASPGQELVLRLETGYSPQVQLYLTGADWFDVKSELCSGAGKCEGTGPAKVWFDKGKRGKFPSHISGKYTVDFRGQHLEGQFKVKYRKHKQQIICE